MKTRSVGFTMMTSADHHLPVAPVVWAATETTTVSDTSSIAGETCSIAGDTCSIAGETCSIAGETCPIAGETCSIAGETCSVAGETCFIAGETCSIAGDGCSETTSTSTTAAAGRSTRCAERAAVAARTPTNTGHPIITTTTFVAVLCLAAVAAGALSNADTAGVISVDDDNDDATTTPTPANESSLFADIQRPFYVIGHMANSISTMDAFLREGANAVEIDVSFEPNGAAWWVFHGVPCDYFRKCHEHTQLVDYLRAAASRPLALLFLDLKCGKLDADAKKFAGVDLARKLDGHFWTKGADDVNVVLSIQYVGDAVLLESFMAEMGAINASQMAKVAFDVSENPDFRAVSKMYRRLNVTAAWQGDGVTNWFEPFRSFSRVRTAIELRDQGDHVIKKVYRWTVDWKGNVRTLIDMGVDGVMTNNPGRALQVVNEMKEVRVAKPKDPIHDLFHL